jgi:hypothetical protein
LTVFNWFQRRREGTRLAHADAEALVRTYGDDAHQMARQFENEALLALLADVAPLRGRTPPQWRRVAHLIALINHHHQSLVAATRFANGS